MGQFPWDMPRVLPKDKRTQEPYNAVPRGKSQAGVGRQKVGFYWHKVGIAQNR